MEAANLRRETPNFYASKEAIDQLSKLSGVDTIVISGIKVFATDLLPIEATYVACDIKTKEEYRIRSGEMIHLIAVPQLFIDEFDTFTIDAWRRLKSHP